MRLERVLLSLHLGCSVEKLDSDPSLDRRRDVPFICVSDFANGRWDSPSSFGMHLTALVMNLSELSLFWNTGISVAFSPASTASVSLIIRVSQIQIARPPIAATTLVSVSEREYTLSGTGTEYWTRRPPPWGEENWMVLSHEAETTRSERRSV